MTIHPNIGRGDIKIPTYKPRTNHKRSSVSSHTLAPTTICDLSHSVCGSPLTDLGHISSVTYVCHHLWFVCGHKKGILTSPLTLLEKSTTAISNKYATGSPRKCFNSFQFNFILIFRFISIPLFPLFIRKILPVSI